MPDPISSDPALNAAKFALDGLMRRQEMIGRNLTNVDTPGYQAQNVDFESSLRRAMEKHEEVRLSTPNPMHLQRGGRAAGLQVTNREGGTWRADGNNVDIDTELNQMAQTGISYSAISQLVSKKLLLLKSIANSR